MTHRLSIPQMHREMQLRGLNLAQEARSTAVTEAAVVAAEVILSAKSGMSRPYITGQVILGNKKVMAMLMCYRVRLNTCDEAVRYVYEGGNF